MDELMERMSAAAAALERVAEQMAERQMALAAEAEQSVGAAQPGGEFFDSPVGSGGTVLYPHV